MATEVARLVARLEADIRDFDRDIKKAEKRLGSLESRTKKTNQSMKKSGGVMGGLTNTVKKFGAAVGIAFAGKAVSDFARDSIRAASDLEESINAVEVTFGEAGDGIKRLGEDAATSVGLANSEFNSLAVGFSAFVDKIDQGGGNVVGIMDDLTTRVADFASVMNLDVAEAGNIFRSALAGETEAIRRFGVDVSAAAVNSKAMALGLAESSSQLSEQDKILARYQLVMEQTQKTAGDFANTSDSLANKQRIFAAELENTKARIGEALLPAMSTALQLARDLLPAFEKWATSIAEVVGQLGPLISLLPKLFEFGQKFAPLANVLGIVGGAVEEVTSWFDKSVQSAQHVQTALDKIGKEAAGSSKQVAAFTTGIKTVAAEGELTEDAIQDMILATDFYKGQLEDTLGATLEWARATGQSTDEVMALEGVLSGVIDNLDLTEDEINALRSAFGLASREIADADRALLNYIKTGKNIPGTTDDVEELAEELTKLETISDRVWTAAGEDVESFLTGFSKLPEEAGITLDEWITNYQDRLQALVDFNENLRTLMEAGLADIALTLASEGAEAGSGLAQELVDSLGSGVAAQANEFVRIGRAINAWVQSGFTDLPFIFRPDPPRFTGDTAAVPLSGGGGSVQSFATGGTVPGPIGQPMVAVVHGGEEIRTPAQQSDGGGVQIGPFHIGEMTENMLDETIEDLLGASLTLHAETR